MKVNHSKNLQKTSKIYSEQKLLELKLLKKSIEKENDYNNYVSKLSNFNKTTGEFEKLTNFVRFKNSQVQTQKNKASAIIQRSIDLGLVGIFLTLTTPIHPYNSRKQPKKQNRVYYKENKNFTDTFENLENGIEQSLYILKEIDHKIYKALKAKTKKSPVYFIKSYEIHSSLMPHLHSLIFIEEKYVDVFKAIVDKYIKKYEFNPIGIDFQKIKNKTGKDQEGKVLSLENQTKLAGYYLQKYLFKSFDNDNNGSKAQNDFQMRLYQGYMRYFNVRQIRMSNLELSMSDYKKIYQSLDRKYIDNLIPKLNKKNIGLFYYVIHNYKKVNLYLNSKNELLDYQQSYNKKKIFMIEKTYINKKLKQTRVFLQGNQVYDSSEKVLHINI